MMNLSNGYSLYLIVLVSSLPNLSLLSGADPTDGFTEIPLTEANFLLQKPYDIPLEERYSYENGVHKMWVYADDKPHALVQGLDYCSGAWQFEGNVFVPNGTSGATIVQIHGAAHGNTTMLLRIYKGEMRYYTYELVDATNLYDKWCRVNLIHNVDGGLVTVFIDGVQKFETHDHGPGDLYFKCGVYGAPSNISYYMESRWKDIKIYKK
ncbi:unnamed protein product [Ilex paraguariensis]|uniref:Alginate lyase 2 domain-containing protein n=1 Tax=Ilex paraguariensis TaxID=185542 RepID=A0ABC8SU83_9AQUA